MNANAHKTIGQITIASFALLALALPDQIHAQFTGNNQTNIISGLTSNCQGNYYVGSNYVFDALLILNGGVLSSGSGDVGHAVSANSNVAIVSGSGSVWNSSGGIDVGVSGAANTLVVRNGGAILSGGYDLNSGVGIAASASNNSALVTDSGSVWGNSSSMAVGYSGAGNTMVVSNGGQVVLTGVSGSTFFNSIGYLASARSNSVIVTGSGSTWSNTWNNGTVFYVGYSGSGNKLVISNGGAVVNTTNSTTIGYDAGASNNSVLVTGAGSMLVSPTNDLVVGNLGSANSLVVSNAGAVFSGGCSVGNSGSGRNNSVLVTGTGSLWSNLGSFSVGGSSNRLAVSDGGKIIVGGLTVGGSGTGNSLAISNGGAVFNDSSGYVGGFAGSPSGRSNNSVLVTGTGSIWSNSLALYIGYSGAGNSLVISNGGKVVSANGYIGYNGSASNNRVVVTGPGSLWLNTFNELYVGDVSSGNSLVIRDGGRVTNGLAYIGGGPTVGGSSNILLVTGSGSVLHSSLRVGFAFPGNSLIVSNGGTVVSGTCSVGSKGNALVTGNGSIWKNGILNFPVGEGALMITNGGCVTASYLNLGLYPAIGSNQINISDGSLWVTNSMDFPGELAILRGTLTLDSGTVTTDRLSLTNDPAGVIAFNGGTLNSADTSVNNAQQFVIGNGTNGATFHLVNGPYGPSGHSFNDGLNIRTNSFLTGCGTINGSVMVDAGATVLADGCGTLTFTGNVTNNGAMIVDNGSILESSGTFVNNGKVLLLHGGTTNFLGTFINNGAVLSTDMVLISNVHRAGNDLLIQIASVTGFTYRLQSASSLQPSNWTDSDPTQRGTGGVLIFTDPGAATNACSRFYRVRAQ